jgi:hypothetical protein
VMDKRKHELELGSPSETDNAGTAQSETSRRAFLRAAAGAAGLVGMGLVGPRPRRAAAEEVGEATRPALGASASDEAAAKPAANGRLLVGYCGVYCGLCEKRGRIPERAASLLAAMEKGEYGAPAQAWKALKEMAHPAADLCCRSGKCGDAQCAIRKCVQAKGLEVCPECDEYPCERVQRFGVSEPLLVADGRRIRERGLNAWVEEQERRRKDGFCYADIRCYPYYFPRE